MTLGMMLAVQSIIGQLDGPISQMISFVYEMQDAKISLERLGEIHEKDEEESEDRRGCRPACCPSWPTPSSREVLFIACEFAFAILGTIISSSLGLG